VQDAAIAGVSDARLLLLTGKGGVGKTTIAAALAVDAARAGRRPLLIELGHRASMRSVFDVAEIGFEPRSVGHGVYAMSVDFDLAVTDYMATHVPSRRLAKAIVGNRVLERLFAAMPAVGEIATLNALHRRLTEMDQGRPRWNPVIVDLDATGHALMFLELRQVVGGLMGAGPMRRLVDEMADLIADPDHSRLCLVTLPDELPVTETLELYARLSAAKSVTFGPIYVNRVPEPPLSAADLPPLDALAASADPDVRDDVAFARGQARAAERARVQIERLAAGVDVPLVPLPQMGFARLSEAQLVEIARRCREGAA
jgi:hypothetical protein